MTNYAGAIEQRFGDGGPSGGNAADNELIHRVLSRKTVRRYNDVVPDENLLGLLTGAALSAPASVPLKTYPVRTEDGKVFVEV